jgi:hypothetical protein
LHALSQLGARLKRECQRVGTTVFSKGMGVTKLTEADVLRVEGLLNNRPRKALDYHKSVRSSPSS